MDFKGRVILGRTGLEVSRLGLASGYGLSAAAIAKAYHEHGINYLYISPYINLANMARAIRHLARGHRDDLFIVLARPFFGGLGGLRLERFVDRWLRKLRLGWTDLLLQDVARPPSPKLIGRMRRLRERGKVRFLGISSHQRPFLGKVARGGVKLPVDFIHLRYNAVHRGAERDIFPHLPDGDRPGTVVYTATCWRKLLKPGRMPAGERPPSAADCYRFALSHPDVNVCISAPSSASQMLENLQALAKGPLDEEEIDRMRRIGAHIYGSNGASSGPR